MTRLSAARCPRSASSPSLTSHIAVAPASAAAGPAAYGGVGRRCAATAAIGLEKPRRSTARPQADHPSRPASATTCPGRAPDRSTGARPTQVAQRGHREHHSGAVGGRRHQVTTDDGGAERGALRGQPGRHALQPRRLGVRRAGQADEQGGRRPAHRGDVGEIRGGGLVADVLGRGPVAPEVPPLHEDVGARHDPPVGGPRTAASSPGPTWAARAEPAWASTRAITPNSPTTRTLSAGSPRGTRGRGRVTCPILPLG